MFMADISEEEIRTAIIKGYSRKTGDSEDYIRKGYTTIIGYMTEEVMKVIDESSPEKSELRRLRERIKVANEVPIDGGV